MINIDWNDNILGITPLVTITRSALEEIVNFQDFSEWCKNNRSHLTGMDKIPLSWYLSYYDERSVKLAAENQLSRGVTVASSKKLESLNNADAIKEYREKFAHVDFD